jgi:GNAT superfamily N-acetyltransferase
MIDEFAPDDAQMARFAALCVTRDPLAMPDPVMPGARCLVAWRRERPVARLSCELVTDMRGAPGRSGIVGHYEATDAAAGISLLRHALRRLAEAGVARVIGPINGSTWGRYRLALGADVGSLPLLQDPPPFFTEPQNPAAYHDQFLAAGFAVASEYESRIVRDLTTARPQASALAARVASSGITIRPLATRHLEEELRALFAFSAAAFGDQPYFRPIDFALFRGMYLHLRPLIDPDLVQLAHDGGGRLLGVVVALPDPLSGAGGGGLTAGRPTRVVLKTLATAPDARRLGLGAHLADEIHRLARTKGYCAVIHALMHVGNDSMKLSTRYASESFRRYALYAWTP